jgi:hypothetical protein
MLIDNLWAARHIDMSEFIIVRPSPPKDGSVAPSPKGVRIEGQPTIDIDFLNAGGYLDMKLIDAAAALCIPRGTLKEIVAHAGLARWPYRHRRMLRCLREHIQLLPDCEDDKRCFKRAVDDYIERMEAKPTLSLVRCKEIDMVHRRVQKHMQDIDPETPGRILRDFKKQHMYRPPVARRLVF